jgi:hypothetical protein
MKTKVQGVKQPAKVTDLMSQSQDSNQSTSSYTTSKYVFFIWEPEKHLLRTYYVQSHVLGTWTIVQR